MVVNLDNLITSLFDDEEFVGEGTIPLRDATIIRKYMNYIKNA